MNTRLKTAIHALDTKGEVLTEEMQEALAMIIETSLSESESEASKLDSLRRKARIGLDAYRAGSVTTIEENDLDTLFPPIEHR